MLVIYELRVNYRSLAYFNDLPTFANPLLDEGLLLSQRSIDLRRRLFNADVEIKRWAQFLPFFEVFHNDNQGRGVTTFVTEGQEFPVGTQFGDTLTSFRGGLKLNNRRWNLTLEQGGTRFADSQRVRLDGAAEGNNRRRLFGADIRLDQLDQRYNADGDGLFSRAALQGRPSERLSFAAQYSYSRPQINVRQDLTASGLFLSPQLMPFSGLTERALGDASRPRSAASWNTVMRLTKRLRLIHSWFTDRFEISSALSIVSTLDEASSIRTVTLSMSRNQIDAVYDLTRRATLRGGHRYEWGAAETPSPSLTFGGGASRTGLVRRHVALAGANVRAASKLRLTLDFEGSPGDQTFFRTGLMSYQKGKARVRYELTEHLVVSGSLSALRNRNEDPTIDLDFRSQSKSVSVTWSPADRPISVVADYSRINLRSSTMVIGLPFFVTELAAYRERAHQGGLYANIRLPNEVTLDVGGTLYTGQGSRPSRFYQPRVGVGGRLDERFRWVAEWRWHGFAERFLHVENFRAHEGSVGIQASF